MAIYIQLTIHKLVEDITHWNTSHCQAAEGKTNPSDVHFPPVRDLHCSFSQILSQSCVPQLCIHLCKTFLRELNILRLQSQISDTPLWEMKMNTVLSVLLLAGMTGAGVGLFMKKYVFVNIELNWDDAQIYCRKNYVDLLTIETQELYKFQSNAANNCTSWCWIGLRRNQDMWSYTLWFDGRMQNYILLVPKPTIQWLLQKLYIYIRSLAPFLL